MNIIITGAGGFIGRNLTKNLSKSNHKIYAYYRNSIPESFLKLNNVICKKVNLVDLKRIKHPVDLTIHCAAEQPETCPNLDEMMKTNVDSNKAIFEASYNYGVKKFIYLSSMAIYGKINTSLVDEDTPINKPDQYGISKFNGEKILSDLCNNDRDIESIILRLPSVIGKGSHSNFLSDVMNNIINENRINIVNPDSLFNNAVYIEDLVSFIKKSLNTIPKGKNIFTISSNDSISIIEMINKLYALLGKKPNIKVVNKNGKSFMISNQKIKRFGFEPRDIDETIAHFAKDNLITD